MLMDHLFQVLGILIKNKPADVSHMRISTFKDICDVDCTSDIMSQLEYELPYQSFRSWHKLHWISIACVLPTGYGMQMSSGYSDIRTGQSPASGGYLITSFVLRML